MFDADKQDNNVTALIFEDKMGVGRYGGMAVAITAVSQVADQFIGYGGHFALLFSFLISIYYTQRAIHLRFLDCIVWVPIYTCVLFITSLGSNNLVGNAIENRRLESAYSQYTARINESEEKIKNLESNLQHYKVALEQSRKARDIYQKLLKAKAPGLNLSKLEHQQSVSSSRIRLLSPILNLLSPPKVFADPPPSPDAPASSGTNQLSQDEVVRMLKELQAIQAKEQENLKAIEPLPKPPSTEEKRKIQQVPVLQHRIWKKW